MTTRMTHYVLSRLMCRRPGIRGTSLAVIAIVAGAHLHQARAASGVYAPSGKNWPSYGGSYSEIRYSALKQINDHTVARLGLSWYLDLPNQRTLEGTPLVIGGTLYFSGTYGRTYAVDVRTGRKLWEFDPNLAHNDPEKLRLNMGANRGIAYWKGRLFVGTNDGRLLALSTQTGRPIWSVRTVDPSKENPRFISGAPRIFNGKVLIGNGNAEAGTRGYVTAYDAESGRQVWRFYTVPTVPARDNAEAMAAGTWSGPPQRWGGGSVWDSIVYDPDFNRVYIATGNGNPVNASIRSPDGGDNLFLCSIVALDADSGRYVWHYQVNPRDAWDYDATAQMVLADLPVDGLNRKVLMQAPKNGFFYVIDRASGELISAEKYAKATWAERVDLQSGRPVETANAHYETKAVVIWPSGFGAHNWQPMSFDPETGLVYIPTLKKGMSLGPPQPVTENETRPRELYVAQTGIGPAPPYAADPDDGTGGLLAWDPVTQQKRWFVQYDTFWNGGVLSTGGNLVFQGTGRGQFVAYRASDGERVWAFDAGLGIIAAPITYSLHGVQYVSVLVGYGGAAGTGSKLFDYGWRFGEQPRRLLTFSLGGRATLPVSNLPRFTLHAVDDPTLTIDRGQALDGAKVYEASFCGLCHGANLQSSGSIAPDLRESHLAVVWPAFRSVLHDGELAEAGMPRFDDLSEQDLRALYMYIRQRAREDRVH